MGPLVGCQVSVWLAGAAGLHEHLVPAASVGMPCRWLPPCSCSLCSWLLFCSQQSSWIGLGGHWVVGDPAQGARSSVWVVLLHIVMPGEEVDHRWGSRRCTAHPRRRVHQGLDSSGTVQVEWQVVVFC